MRRLPPEVLLLASIASVQFGAGVAITLFDRVGPGGAVLLRLGISALLLLALARPRLRGVSRAGVRSVVVFGLVLGLMNWSFYEALQRLPLGVAVTIEFLGPLAVAVWGSRRVLDLVWVGLAGLGVVIIALRGDNHGVTPVGILFAAIAGALWAAYILASQEVGNHFPGVDGLAWALTIATCVVLPIGLIDGGRELWRPGVLGAGLAIALLSSLIPYSLELIALRRLSAASFGLLMSLEPAFGALAGALVLDQRLSALTVVAIAMVMVASAGTTVFSRRAPKVVEPGVSAPGPLGPD